MNKILHVVPSLAAGGIENLLLNYSIEGPIYDNFQIDFITHAKTGLIHDTLLERGFSVFYVTPKKVSLIKNFKETAKVIKSGNYDIVHVHQTYSSFLALFIAKIYKVPVRIVHSHTNMKYCESPVKKVINFIMRCLCCTFANELWACGCAAGEYLYGTKKNFYIMPNAIDSSNFISDDNEDKIRIFDKIGIEDNNIIISQIGRFTYEKNHDFTIKIINEIVKQDSRFLFVFAGDGPLREEIKQNLAKYNLLSRCKFLGNINYVSDLLSVSSVVLLPSLFEGFPVTVVESLFSGTPIICSENISKEVEFSNLCKRLPYDEKLWVEKIFEYSRMKDSSKKECSLYMLSSDYEIKNARKLICQKYIDLLIQTENRKELGENKC